MKVPGRLITACLFTCISGFCYAQSYFEPSYAAFEMLDHNPKWIVNNKVKAINIREYLVSDGKPERNVTIRLLFDDSGRIVKKFTSRGKDESEDLSDKKFALNQGYTYKEENGFCRQYMLSIRAYNENGKLPQPDTLVEVLMKSANPLKLAREIYSHDTSYYEYDDKGNLIRKYNANGSDELKIRYNSKGQLLEIMRRLSMGRFGGNSRHLFKYKNQQVESIVVDQFSGPKVLIRYYYNNNGYLLKSEFYIDNKLMSYFEYRHESL